MSRRFPIVLIAASLAGPAAAQTDADYSRPASAFPRVYQPYIARHVPAPDLTNSAASPMEIRDGKLRLSMDQLVKLVIENNLTIASARYYPSMAQTDLLRARSGNSPRGVDVSSIPSGVFAGAVGGTIAGLGEHAARGRSKLVTACILPG